MVKKVNNTKNYRFDNGNINPILNENLQNNSEIVENTGTQDAKIRGSAHKKHGSIENSNEFSVKTTDPMKNAVDFCDEVLDSMQQTRKYLGCPDGKRKWVQVVSPKVRGEVKKPRKRGEDHKYWRHRFGKSRP